MYEEQEDELKQVSMMITNVYQSLSTVLFCILSWLLAMHYRQIAQEIGTVDQQDQHDQQDAGDWLCRWSVRHSLIIRAVGQLESYFTYILIMSVSCIFVMTVNRCFALIDDHGPLELVLIAFNIGKGVVQLGAISCAADLIRSEAGQLAEDLARSKMYRSDACPLKVI